MAATGWRARPQDISALEVIRTIDGPIILTQCFTEHTGLRSKRAVPGARAIAQGSRRHFGPAGEITLADLASDDMPIPGVIPNIRPALANIQMTSSPRSTEITR